MFKTQNLYQNDEKWQNVKLGNSSITIGKWGCLLTSVTMMLNGIGHKETPETVKEKRGDDYVIYDPFKYGGDAPDKEFLLTKRYKYNGARLETEISAVLWFD